MPLHPLARLPIVKRFYPSLRKKWAKHMWPGGHKIIAYHGLRLIIHYRNYIDRQIAFYGGYEEAQVAYLLRAMRERTCDLFIDVGANFGLYTLQVAQSGAAAAVYAFEPDERNAAQLGGNLYLNRLTDKVTLSRQAVSAQSGELTFNLYPETSTGQTRAAEDGNAKLMATTLDETFAITNKKLFIKIDIEGHELSALQGG
ncbi:MAG TPA: FkbM family methyltransferase, partial [Alphaproteobacteria bacterium]|nr:FkbM family methyltransferase [Alphaproteobacteria bacterium]